MKMKMCTHKCMVGTKTELFCAAMFPVMDGKAESEGEGEGMAEGEAEGAYANAEGEMEGEGEMEDEAEMEGEGFDAIADQHMQAYPASGFCSGCGHKCAEK